MRLWLLLMLLPLLALAQLEDGVTPPTTSTAETSTDTSPVTSTDASTTSSAEPAKTQSTSEPNTDMTSTGSSGTPAPAGSSSTNPNTEGSTVAKTTTSPCPDCTTQSPPTKNTADTETPVTGGTSPSQPTEGPTTTGEPKTTTDPINYVTVKMDNNFDQPLNAKDVLQSALVLSNTVISLTNEINQLENSMDPNNSPLLAELSAMQNNATGMNLTLVQLTQQLQSLSSQQTNLTKNYNTSLGFYQCLALSQCVTSAPTTTEGPTTTPLPTTTPKLTRCPDNPADNNDTATYKDFTLDTTQNIVCSQTISGGTLNVDLNVTVTITNTAQLKVSDAFTGTVLQTFTASASDVPIMSSTPLVQLDYSAIGDGNTIKFDIKYKAANACDGKDCKNGGKCELTSTGAAHCVCEGCYSADTDGLCTVESDPCTSTAKRLCKTGNTCKTNSDDPQVCNYYCACGGVDDHTAKQCSTSGDASFFERWFR